MLRKLLFFAPALAFAVALGVHSASARLGGSPGPATGSYLVSATLSRGSQSPAAGAPAWLDVLKNEKTSGLLLISDLDAGYNSQLGATLTLQTGESTTEFNLSGFRSGRQIAFQGLINTLAAPPTSDGLIFPIAISGRATVSKATNQVTSLRLNGVILFNAGTPGLQIINVKISGKRSNVV